MSQTLPTAYQSFTEEYPEVWEAYEQLGTGKVELVGESPYKKDFRYMSFKPRDVT